MPQLRTDCASVGQHAGSGRRSAGQHGSADRIGRAGNGAEEVVEAQAAHRRGAAVDAGVVLLFVAHGADIGVHRGSVGHGVLPFMWHYAHKATEVT